MIFLFLAFTAIAPAAELKASPEFRAILDLASAAPPEFNAQAILRIVASGKITDRETRRALLIQAFQSAANAHVRLPRSVIKGAGVDTEAGALDGAYRLRLDALSLQSQAVMLLLKDNHRKARELFEDMARPLVPPLACEDALVYEVSDFYRALQAVVEQAFTDEERRKEDHVRFLLDYLGAITSPSQLAPVARLLTNIGGLTPKQREVLINRYNGILESVNPDSRAFSAASEEIEAAITPQLRGSYEKFRDRMNTASPCGNPDPQRPKKLDSNALAADGVMPDPQPFWQAPGAKAMIKAARAVRFGEGGKMWNDADRETSDWRDRFANLLASIGSWSSDPGESTAIHYHERTILYEGLIEVAPTAAMRQRVLEDFAAFVNASPLQRDNPPEWFAAVPAIWSRIPFVEPGEQAAFAEVLTRTGNSVFTLYLMLEKTIPQPLGASH